MSCAFETWLTEVLGFFFLPVRTGAYAIRGEQVRRAGRIGGVVLPIGLAVDIGVFGCDGGSEGGARDSGLGY